jgi:hypothetical protein
VLGRGAGQTEEGRPGGVEGVGPAPQAHNPLDQGVLLHAGPASQPRYVWNLKKRCLKVVTHYCFQKVNHNPRLLEDYKHGLIYYTGTKAKCRHLKNWPVLGLCSRCLSEFTDWRYSQSCWYFRPSFVNCCTSNLPPPLPCVNMYTVYMYSDCKGVGGEDLGLIQINTCRKVP